MKMNELFDAILAFKEKVDIADFLLNQSGESHKRFLYGEQSPYYNVSDIFLYEKMIETVGKILFSEEDYVWNQYTGISLRSEVNCEKIELYFSDDIKKLYQEQLS